MRGPGLEYNWFLRTVYHRKRVNQYHPLDHDNCYEYTDRNGLTYYVAVIRLSLTGEYALVRRHYRPKFEQSKTRSQKAYRQIAVELGQNSQRFNVVEPKHFTPTWVERAKLESVKKSKTTLDKPVPPVV